MQVVYTRATGAYRPKNDYSDGFPPFPCLEVPERLTEILRAVEDLAIPAREVEPRDHGDILLSIHEREYVEFLSRVCVTISEAEEVVPVRFLPRAETGRLDVRRQIGSFTREIGTPLTRETFHAAKTSFDFVCEAASLFAGIEGHLLALARPPGHHAGRATFGGHCFFNNGMGAARVLSAHGRVAILDLDYHLGDGTLEFLDERTRYFSLHADSRTSYPYREFQSDEHPFAKLAPLAPGARIEDFLEGLGRLLGEIDSFGPDRVVVLLGFDIVLSDFIQDEPLAIRPEEVARVARILNEWRSKLFFVLEGGYDLGTLRQTARSFLAPLR